MSGTSIADIKWAYMEEKHLPALLGSLLSRACIAELPAKAQE